MNRLIALFFIFAPLVLWPSSTWSVTQKPLPTIVVTPNIWSGASVKDIQKVLQSTVRQIWPYATQSNLSPIQVDRSRTGPIVLYQRGEKGQYLIRLDTEKKFWCQYAFQFAHEFGHIICEYKEGDRSNLWFEETLCETASLFALRKMSEEWKINPPYPNWKSYGDEFAKYAQNRIDKHPWSESQTLAQWYAQKKHNLNEEPTDRPRNVRLASQLLHYFEKDPTLWGACAFINQEKTGEKRSFRSYLHDWKKSCPKSQQKELVQKLITLFGLGQ